MTSTQKIAKGLDIIEKTVFQDIMDLENYSVWSNQKIDFIDNMPQDNDFILDYEVSLTFNFDKVICFILRVNLENENLEINTYEDVFEKFTDFDYTVGNFWRVLLFNSVS